jgi:hypothetical protein
MNVFFVGVPLKIGVGLLAVIISLPTFGSFLENRISDIVAGAGVITGAAREGEPAPTTTSTAATAANRRQVLDGTNAALASARESADTAAPDAQGEVNAANGR